jgi:CheY-like chemotaxis protein
MIVDDDRQCLDLIKAIVEPLGYETVALENSREALKRIEKDKVDGVFLDARMPILDGFELTRCIRKSRSNGPVPIVMITGCDDVESMRKGFSAGVTFFLGKPVIPARLRGLMKAIYSSVLREKRRYARLPLSTAVTCRVGTRHFQADCVNISETGMLLENSGGLVVGDELSLEFSVPGTREPVTLRAKIARKDQDDRTGVQFTALTPDQLQTIQDYVSGKVKF